MSIEVYTQEIDFITTIIRQEIGVAINGLGNRLAGLASKDLIMSAAAYYSTVAIIADLIDTHRYITFLEIERTSLIGCRVHQDETERCRKAVSFPAMPSIKIWNDCREEIHRCQR
ncbi:hypothetical protein CAY60_011975 [Shouchella clausii]|uniref:hypothetical protein n=1 Tax=Shouchella TaxID=2893057 RepID=UPI000691A2D6|nr:MULTISPECIES: hypothetical protein [Shouchella]MBU3232863.1 hypothetical protein [Shouchella clausii]MBU3265760.1 hypothetical protein [Shouchella clausii]MBU3508411.1 hypothetical protein [Shouchella clausii]MBU3534454.1 hypothetical protein [Shouchella clausii]MBX0308002.1 hypothetical protein [Shouchella clausii]